MLRNLFGGAETFGTTVEFGNRTKAAFKVGSTVQRITMLVFDPCFLTVHNPPIDLFGYSNQRVTRRKNRRSSQRPFKR